MILYTGGTYDLFHYGHVNFLQHCAKISDEVVVSLNTDEFVAEFKRPPIMSYSERERSLLGCQYVDRVIPNSGGSDSKPAILTVNPDIIAIGDDWAKKDYMAQMGFTREWLTENDILLIYLPYTTDISTTEIIKRIEKRFGK